MVYDAQTIPYHMRRPSTRANPTSFRNDVEATPLYALPYGTASCSWGTRGSKVSSVLMNDFLDSLTHVYANGMAKCA